MTTHSHNFPMVFDLNRLSESHEIVYLVKRTSYEFIFAVPKKGNHQSSELPIFQVRFKDQQQIPGFVLSIEEMEDFYEGLCQLIEYVRAEQLKHK